jgi:hypothetical protein
MAVLRDDHMVVDGDAKQLAKLDNLLILMSAVREFDPKVFE